MMMAYIKARKSGNIPERLLAWSKDNVAFLLLLLTLVLFTSKSLYNIPVAIMAIIGFWQTVVTRGKVLADPIIYTYTLLFLSLWLPMLISLPDAKNMWHSTQTVFPYLRFLFMGIFILNEKNRIVLLPKIRLAIFYIAAFWGIDGCIQFLSGANLAGYPYEPGHITGMFYPRNTIAHILAALSPLFFESVRVYSKRYKWVWLLLLPVITVILLSGRRAAWLMLAMSISGYIFYLYRFIVVNNNAKKNLLAIICIGLATAALVIVSNKPLQDRIVTTAGLLSLDYEITDIATARRLPIWETAVAVFRDNWINGVGPRGFRHVYKEYSSEDNFWHETSTTHPHQLLLEVLAETGIIGLVGIIVFILLFYRHFLSSVADGRLLFPWTLSIVIILFPFNSSLAFYSSYWASVIWWFLVLSLLALKHSKVTLEEKLYNS